MINKNGILFDMAKSGAKALAPVLIDAAANAAQIKFQEDDKH